MTSKPIQGLTRDNAWVIGWEGQSKFFLVNVRIKIVIIIVLKLDSRIDMGPGSSHESG